MGNPTGRGNPLQLVGKRFHSFIVLDQSDKRITQEKYSYVTWKCLCDCGKEFITTSKAITRGKKSCGCHWRVSELESSIQGRLCHYQSAARRRKHEWSLSREEFKTLILGNCFYCKIAPSLLYDRRNSNVFFNGIDRVDSSKGYRKDNVVSCCHICNRGKNDLKVEDFLKWIKRLQELA